MMVYGADMSNQWISVEERLPENAERVFVHFTSSDCDDCDRYGKPQVGIGEFMRTWWCEPKDNSFSEESWTVTHWMPLDWPEAP